MERHKLGQFMFRKQLNCPIDTIRGGESDTQLIIGGDACTQCGAAPSLIKDVVPANIYQLYRARDCEAGFKSYRLCHVLEASGLLGKAERQ